MPENKHKLTSTVVVSQSFLKEQERREKAKERRLHRFRRSESDEEDKAKDSRRDRDRRERRTSEKDAPSRLGRRQSERDENENRGWQRDRNAGRSQADRPGGQRNSVFDRLDKRTVQSRLGRKEFVEYEDREEGEIVTDPTEVPRADRYFMHDDRDGPRGRPMMRRQPMRRMRSRSPVWKHDMFDKVQQEKKDNEDTRNVIEKDPEQDRSSKWKHDKFEQDQEEPEQRKGSKWRHDKFQETQEEPEQRKGSKWRHDKFEEEMEQEESHQPKESEREERRSRRRSKDRS